MVQDKKMIIQSLIVSITFGLFGYLFMKMKIVIPITESYSLDFREVFILLSAAISGPMGAVITSLLAQDYTLHTARLVTNICAHTAAALWISFFYRFVAIRQKKLQQVIILWCVSIIIYYEVFLNLTYMVVMNFFEKGLALKQFGVDTYFKAWLTMVHYSAPELLYSALLTSVILIALPKKLRKPLWA